jgi:hypothetical protein
VAQCIKQIVLEGEAMLMLAGWGLAG